MVPRTAIARPGVSRYGGVKEQETDSGVGGVVGSLITHSFVWPREPVGSI